MINFVKFATIVFPVKLKLCKYRYFYPGRSNFHIIVIYFNRSFPVNFYRWCKLFIFTISGKISSFSVFVYFYSLS